MKATASPTFLTLLLLAGVLALFPSIRQPVTAAVPRPGRHALERTGARFLHHDGGIENSSSLLPGLISKADVLVFPIDCISHDAVATLKRLCWQLEKPYRPLRTASLATLASSLAGMARNPTA